MKMIVKMPIYIKPGKGQTVAELTSDILEVVQGGKLSGHGYKIFMERPNGETIEITGEDWDHIHGSIMTQCEESVFYYE